MKNFKLFLVALVGIALSSCSMMNKDATDYQVSDLQGTWRRDNSNEYWHYTAEQSDENPYLWGREWDLDDDVTEQDRLDQRQRDGFPGNGWFKYWLETSGKLTEIHFMDNGGAEIPKIYIVTTLTSTKLAYYEKDQKSNKFSFTKQ